MSARNLPHTREIRGIGSGLRYCDSFGNYSPPNGVPGTGTLSHYQPTPSVTYFYDGSNVAGGIPYSKGKLTKVSSSVSTTEYTAFDILGRVTGHKQTTDGQEYATAYVYNLSGALVEQTYPFAGMPNKSSKSIIGGLAASKG